MDVIIDAISSIDAFVWGPPMIIMLLGSHLFLTFRTRFIQRKIPTAIKLSATSWAWARPSWPAARARCCGCG